jgi:GDP-D-mannose dehydratase
LESVALNDFRSVIQVLYKAQPDEIYNLAGQSSVGFRATRRDSAVFEGIAMAIKARLTRSTDI